MSTERYRVLALAVLLAVLVLGVVMFLPSVRTYSLIDQNRVIYRIGDVDVTTGDLLLIYSIFACSVTIAMLYPLLKGKK